MVRLLRAFTSTARAVVPRTRFIHGRCYSSIVDASKTANAAAPALESTPSGPSTAPLNDPRTDSQPAPRPNALPEGVYCDKKVLGIPRPGGMTNYLHMMLRDACRCSRCVDPYSKQRNFRTSDISPDIRPRSVRLDGDTLSIKWKDDTWPHEEPHVSTYSLKDLENQAAIPLRSTAGMKRSRVLWDRMLMNSFKHWISYHDFMHDGPQFVDAMRHLALTGLIFVKDIPDSRDEVEKIATRMGPIRNTFYGPTWDVRSVPQAKNVAYTNQNLDFHMDLMYMKEPPGYQLLHCLENSCAGGESLFLDSFHAADRIFKQRFDIFEKLAWLHLNYEYNHADHVYNNSWPVFEVGPNFSREDMDLLHVNYSPPFQGRMVRNKDVGSAVASLEALRIWVRQLKDKSRIYELKLQPGECVIFENRRVLHARRPFDLNSGNRWLAGTYVDEDALLSRFRTLSRKYPADWYGYYLAEGKQTAWEMYHAGMQPVRSPHVELGVDEIDAGLGISWLSGRRS